MLEKMILKNYSCKKFKDFLTFFSYESDKWINIDPNFKVIFFSNMIFLIFYLPKDSIKF